MTQSFNLCQPRLDYDDTRWLSAAVGYRWLNESTQGDDFDLTGNSISASLAMPLPETRTRGLATEGPASAYTLRSHG